MLCPVQLRYMSFVGFILKREAVLKRLLGDRILRSNFTEIHSFYFRKNVLYIISKKYLIHLSDVILFYKNCIPSCEFK